MKNFVGDRYQSSRRRVRHINLFLFILLKKKNNLNLLMITLVGDRYYLAYTYRKSSLFGLIDIFFAISSRKNAKNS